MSPYSLLLIANGVVPGNTEWEGGIAALLVVGTPGTITLQALGPDQVTWVTIATTSAAGITTPLYVPAGEVRATGGTAGVYVSLQAVLN